MPDTDDNKPFTDKELKDYEPLANKHCASSFKPWGYGVTHPQKKEK